MELYQIDRNGMAYAEGMDDALVGDNLNPYDPDYNLDEWKSYEQGFLDGIFTETTIDKPLAK